MRSSSSRWIRPKSSLNKTQGLYATVRNISIIAILAGVLLAAFIGVWLIRAISGPLNEAVTDCQKRCSG